MSISEKVFPYKKIFRYIEQSLPWSDDTKTYYDTDLRSLALSAIIDEVPGKRFHYNNYNPLLLGLILERTSHKHVSQYLEEKIWKPLGMEASASWSLDSDTNRFEKMESGGSQKLLTLLR